MQFGLIFGILTENIRKHGMANICFAQLANFLVQLVFFQHIDMISDCPVQKIVNH